MLTEYYVGVGGHEMITDYVEKIKSGGEIGGTLLVLKN